MIRVVGRARAGRVAEIELVSQDINVDAMAVLDAAAKRARDAINTMQAELLAMRNVAVKLREAGRIREYVLALGYYDRVL